MMTAKEWLQVLLDQIDYERGACRPNEMIGALVSREVLQSCREAAAPQSLGQPSDGGPADQGLGVAEPGPP